MVSGLGTGAAWCRPVLRPAVAVLVESEGFMGSRGIRGVLCRGLRRGDLGKSLSLEVCAGRPVVRRLGCRSAAPQGKLPTRLRVWRRLANRGLNSRLCGCIAASA